MTRKRVFLVVQDGEVFRVLNNLLRELGHETRSAKDPHQAIYAVGPFNPDLVICEDELPRISGRQLGRLFKSHRTLAKAPFVLATRRPLTREPSGEPNAPDDILRLPFERENLIEVLGRRLGEADELQALLRAAPPPALAAPQPARRRQDWRNGGLSIHTLARLFVQLIATKACGALQAAGDRKMLRALVDKSDLVDVHSTHLRDQTLGRHLRAQHVIDEAMEENAFALSLDLRVAYGQALVMLGAINREQLTHHLTNHKVAKLTRLFTPEWTPAHLQFTAAPGNGKSDGMKPSDLADILYQGVMKHAVHKDIHDSFVRADRLARPIALSKEYAEIGRMLHLPSDDLARGRQFAGRTIEELGALNPMDFAHNMRLAFLLAAARAITFRPTRHEDRKPPAAEPPLLATEPATPDALLPCDFEAFARAVTVAESALSQSNYLEARERLRLACEINPHSSHALALLAWTEFRIGGRVNPNVGHDSKEMLKTAIALDDGNALAYLYLGKILREEGKPGLAAGVLARAGQLNPSHREIRAEILAGGRRG